MDKDEAEAFINSIPYLNEEKMKVISEYMSNLARLSHQKHPRGRDYFSKIGKIGKRKPMASPSGKVV